ncbi:hypothetical protein FA95DRAFT_1604620 [Auriscalpium vulgare]|uniref:Uncharacterized protein n=1 Tax=Auriscalpium vulgare TaxID=40419 RepID=A0ACB8RZS5_9AGAM|nr:hypothetical protein FA95DRAFT_1604620 [Auriscalpium vulgare]
MSTPPEYVFTDDAPVIVDGDVLEAKKENIQPLASGRRATTLSAILSTPHVHRESKLAATRNRLRINVEVALEDEDDDPLDAYSQLVYWTVENYPEGHSAESGLLELLEEATRVLKDDRDGRWRSDMRYLKLWVLYASYVEKPQIIYRYLMANDIGTCFALLYEEHAIVVERNGRRNEADEIYLLGIHRIHRQATPLEHLQMRHREFQKRMMLASSMPAAPPSPQAPSTKAASKRKVLGESSTSRTASSSSSSRTARAPSVSTAPPVTEDVFGAGASTRARPNARLQVFVDPSGEDSQAAGNPWEELGTRKARIKENVPDVAKMGGTTLKQPGKHQRLASAGTSRIAVFKDPEPGDGDAAGEEAMSPPRVPASRPKEKVKELAPKTPARGGFVPFTDEESAPVTPFRDEASSSASGSAVPDTVMKAKRVGGDMSSEAEALRKDPFKNYSDRPADVD